MPQNVSSMVTAGERMAVFRKSGKVAVFPRKDRCLRQEGDDHDRADHDHRHGSAGRPSHWHCCCRSSRWAASWRVSPSRWQRKALIPTPMFIKTWGWFVHATDATDCSRSTACSRSIQSCNTARICCDVVEVRTASLSGFTCPMVLPYLAIPLQSRCRAIRSV